MKSKVEKNPKPPGHDLSGLRSRQILQTKRRKMYFIDTHVFLSKNFFRTVCSKNKRALEIRLPYGKLNFETNCILNKLTIKSDRSLTAD